MANQYSNGYRQVPDVSALGDWNTGWAVFSGGSWQPNAGTSAAAPLWAGLTALTDQALAHFGLAPVGFADIPLYSFAQNSRKQPAPAFDDVTTGGNPATWFHREGGARADREQRL